MEDRIIKIAVTSKNLWFLERSIPLFGLLKFFPEDVIGPPAAGKPDPGVKTARKMTFVTDQGWNFTTDITSDSKIFRNSSRSRGTGKWVVQAELKPGDQIVIEKIDEYNYRLAKESLDHSQAAQ